MQLRGLVLTLLLTAAAPAAPPEIIAVRQTLTPEIYQQIRAQMLPETGADRGVEVKRYEKLELRVELRATFDNPYDPDQVDLWAEFTAPSGKLWKIWGFYNPTSWASLWMVRFAPNETGVWRVTVKVRDTQGEAVSKPRQVTVTESAHHGFLGLASNKRYWQYSDGAPFYGVGMWYNDAYELFDRGLITESGLDELKRHGANFISFYHTPLETMGTGLGRYDENRAGRLDQIFEWCEQRDMNISWNIWFHSNISEEVWGGGNARYRNNPYRQVAPAEQLFTSEEAWKYMTRLHRYMVARWGYSRALMLWFVIDEINGTEGWLKGGAEGAERWCQRVHDWLKANDPYHRPTTGTRSGGIKEWWPGGYQIFDVAAREIYELQGHPAPPGGKQNLVSENPLKFSYLNYAKQTQDLWSGFEKPAIIGECGYDHTFHEPAMPGYLEMVHNALWTGLANGLSMTPFWWANGPYINPGVVGPSTLYFSRFVRDIPFASAAFKPVKLDISDGDGWAMQSPGLTFGWAVNSLSGIAGETLQVPGLADGEYDVHFYRPWRGLYEEPVSATATGGVLTVRVPLLRPRGGRVQNMGTDAAFKIVKKGTAIR
jgi:hypothetical protein